jgi:hypothetical protein
MFQKIQFEYKKHNRNSQKYLLQKQEEISKKYKKLDEISIHTSLNLSKQINPQRIQPIHQNMMDYTAEEKSNYVLEDDKMFHISVTSLKKDTSQKMGMEMYVEPIIDETFFPNDIQIPFNINEIRKRKINVINNVYQKKYKNTTKSSGFGDFIRGSYFILELCEKFQFIGNIIFNNSISKFLNKKTNISKFTSICNNISFFENINFKEYVISPDGNISDPLKDNNTIMSHFIDYTKSVPVYCNNIFVYSICYPMEEISAKNKQYMRDVLDPVNEIKIQVKNILQNLDLVMKKYCVIHIRSGDDYLNNDNKIFKNSYLSKLLHNIKNYISSFGSSSKKYLLISDNNEIKFIINQQFPFIKCIYNEITHFGEGVELEDEKVKNTLIDFYLLSFACDIICYSCYDHGSGFSYWCAKTFDIPYKCILIK